MWVWKVGIITLSKTFSLLGVLSSVTGNAITEPKIDEIHKRIKGTKLISSHTELSKTILQSTQLFH